MTSYTRKLYAADPKAAAAFYQSQQFETRSQVGRHVSLPQFDSGFTKLQPRPFGKRKTPPGPRSKACTEACSHPACSNGCVLVTATVTQTICRDHGAIVEGQTMCSCGNRCERS